MPKIPTDIGYNQTNTSDKTGTVFYTKNVNFDEEGYVKLSPRTMVVQNQDDNTNFGIPVAIGKVAEGDYIVNTSSNAVFNVAVKSSAFTFAENDGSNEPTLTSDSHGVYYNDLWFASTDTAVFSRAISTDESAAWTSRITGLTSGKRHYLEVFRSRNELCVSNGNVIKQYNTSYANTTNLTIPSDFEIIGMAYNNQRMGVITRPATSSTNTNAYFFTWDGASTTANQGFDIGSDAAVSVVAYKSSFALLTRNGRLLYFNGGGFDELGELPFYNQGYQLGLSTSNITLSDSIMVDGDLIFINTAHTLQSFTRKEQNFQVRNPSGVWCFDPKVGLYHRYTPSASRAYQFTVTDANVNTSTDLFTVSSGTLPATGSLVRYTFSTTEIGGLELQQDYYLIKVTDTTFRLATSKANAQTNTYIDITSKGSGSSNFFYIYDVVDYGASYVSSAGAISKLQATNTFSNDIFIGGDFYDTSMTTKDGLCMCVPFLENRGYIVYPKIFSSAVTDNSGHLMVRFRPLDTNDKIIIKTKDKDVMGLPVSSTDNGSWLGQDILSTTTDISEAKTYLDAGGEIEIEFTAGAGAGSLVKVDSIALDSGTYSIQLEEDVDGAAAGLSCRFVLDNWTKRGTIDNSNVDGYQEIAIDNVHKYTLVKAELRGYETTIEDIDFRPKTHKKSL